MVQRRGVDPGNQGLYGDHRASGLQHGAPHFATAEDAEANHLQDAAGEIGWPTFACSGIRKATAQMRLCTRAPAEPACPADANSIESEGLISLPPLASKRSFV